MGSWLVWIPIRSVRNGLQKQGCNPYCCALPLYWGLEQKSACLSLCALSFFYETELGVSRPLGSLRKVGRDKRSDSQLPLHLLCTLECPNFSDTHGIQLCLCLLHGQVQQKQTSGKLFPLCPVPFSETSMKMETSLVKVSDDPFFVKL